MKTYKKSDAVLETAAPTPLVKESNTTLIYSPSAAPKDEDFLMKLYVTQQPHSNNDGSSNDMTTSNDMADIPDSVSDRVTTDVPVESIGDTVDATEAPETETTDSATEETTTETTVPTEGTDASVTTEITEESSTSAPETTVETEASTEETGTSDAETTTEGQMVDISLNNTSSDSEVSDIVDSILSELDTPSPTVTPPFSTGSGSATYAPAIDFTFNETSAPEIDTSTEEVSTSNGGSMGDKVSFPENGEEAIINVNEDPGVLPGGAEAPNGFKTLYGSNDVFIHTSLCLLCIFFFALR